MDHDFAKRGDIDTQKMLEKFRKDDLNSCVVGCGYVPSVQVLQMRLEEAWEKGFDK